MTIRICSIEGCGRRHLAKGLCNAHYQKQWAATHDALREKTVGELAAEIENRSLRIPFSGCWVWLGPLRSKKSGYGAISVGGERRVDLAHRTAYSVFKGLIPNGMLVCHECDNPACVNPNHLFLGSAKDNAQDMLTKGRGNKLRGEGQPMSKLTEDQALAIFALKGRGQDIALEFGISKGAVNDIRAKRTWKHLHA